MFARTAFLFYMYLHHFHFFFFLSAFHCLRLYLCLCLSFCVIPSQVPTQCTVCPLSQSRATLWPTKLTGWLVSLWLHVKMKMETRMLVFLKLIRLEVRFVTFLVYDLTMRTAYPSIHHISKPLMHTINLKDYYDSSTSCIFIIIAFQSDGCACSRNLAQFTDLKFYHSHKYSWDFQQIEKIRCHLDWVDPHVFPL